MKIQFIITGWYFNYDDLINGLLQLKNENDIIDVYYSCHKDPPQFIKDNFKWKLYPNLGMGDGGFQQAMDDLTLEDNTLCFFMQDDIIMKDWSFIEVCSEMLETYKFIGNCQNYASGFDPNRKLQNHGIFVKDCAKDSTRHLFDQPQNQKNIKTSFICCKYGDIKEIGFFEPMFHYPELITPFYDESLKCFRTKNEKGLGGIGNTIQNMFNYKINKVFGHESIAYLSDVYLDSKFMYECSRGGIDENRPPKL